MYNQIIVVRFLIYYYFYELVIYIYNLLLINKLIDIDQLIL
jgi:hypothetical protein